MKKILCLNLLAWVTLSSTAFAGGPAWHGVWKGAIGRQQVMVCLDETDSSSYYYRHHSFGIALSAKDKSGTSWTEMSKGKKTGEWKFVSITRNRLTGSWSGFKGQRSLPIIMERTVASSDGQLCDGDTYNDPRIESTKIHTGKAGSFEGKLYRKVSALKVTTIELLGNGQNIGVINKALRTQLRADIKSFYLCHDFVNAREADIADNAEYSVNKEPVFWSSRWLTLAISAESDCGGVHPNHGFFYETRDLRHGNIVDLWSWFAVGNNQEPSAALNKLIISHANAGEAEEECSTVIAENTTYDLRPAKEGMVFFPLLPHAAIGCQNDILVPYGKLFPFLSSEGLKEVKALIGDTHYK